MPAISARRPSLRIVLLIGGMANLLVALNAALIKLGVWAPVNQADGNVHGYVMVIGFLGSLISLERAQALSHKAPWHRWAYLSPLLLASGGLSLGIGGMGTLIATIGHFLMIEGAFTLCAIYCTLHLRTRGMITAAQILSALCLSLATILVLLLDISQLICVLAAFVIITIISERAELAQLSMGPRAAPTLFVTSSLLVLTSGVALIWPTVGNRIFGVVLLIIALWLIRYDVPRVLIRRTGVQRFTAVSLLAGYIWLIVSALVLIVTAFPPGTILYDLVIHAIFVGFAMSMIMAHAPIIFPAVLGLPVPFVAAMWIPLIALHVGLGIRVSSQILVGQADLWIIGAVTNLLAILGFLVTTATVIIRAAMRR
ncbi:hypothetical protein [Arcanobacterium phocae]|uniref:hypothetical protein n=1 Tax=Arcanobacterium phocae TaxID=131112 RepID=UPI001C0EBBB9|nr:hypothetical protein [Arcanobacterium phocae]